MGRGGGSQPQEVQCLPLCLLFISSRRCEDVTLSTVKITGYRQRYRLRHSSGVACAEKPPSAFEQQCSNSGHVALWPGLPQGEKKKA